MYRQPLFSPFAFAASTSGCVNAARNVANVAVYEGAWSSVTRSIKRSWLTSEAFRPRGPADLQDSKHVRIQVARLVPARLALRRTHRSAKKTSTFVLQRSCKRLVNSRQSKPKLSSSCVGLCILPLQVACLVLAKQFKRQSVSFVVKVSIY